MCFSLPQLFVLFDVLSVAVFVISDRFVKKADFCLNLYACVIKCYLLFSLSLSLPVCLSVSHCLCLSVSLFSSLSHPLSLPNASLHPLSTLSLYTSVALPAPLSLYLGRPPRPFSANLSPSQGRGLRVQGLCASSTTLVK